MTAFPEEGPEQYSWWMYWDRQKSPYQTILKVDGWHKNASGGSVSLRFFTFHGTTDNIRTPASVPTELRRVTIEGFWQLVQDGKLASITLSPGEIQPDRGLFAEGDPIGPPTGKLNL